MRALRGVNETISSLLLSYIAIALFNHLVEGPMRDPASLNKPSTWPIGDANAAGRRSPAWTCTTAWSTACCACLVAWVLMQRTMFGFAARMVGGNVRAALLAGLPVRGLTIAGLLPGAAAPPAWPAWPRWRRCTAAPTPR